jgi:hypothetical protein
MASSRLAGSGRTRSSASEGEEAANALALLGAQILLQVRASGVPLYRNRVRGQFRQPWSNVPLLLQPKPPGCTQPGSY